MSKRRRRRKRKRIRRDPVPRIGKAGRGCLSGGARTAALRVRTEERERLLARPVPEEFLHCINDERICRIALPASQQRRFYSEGVHYNDAIEPKVSR